jgi:hypothetical protein
LEHLARLEEIEKLRELGGDRLLKKRQKQEENMFKKSVSFITPVSSINKTDRHDITEILLKVALNTIKQTNHQSNTFLF